jgi:hypothetical protein
LEYSWLLARKSKISLLRISLNTYLQPQNRQHGFKGFFILTTLFPRSHPACAVGLASKANQHRRSSVIVLKLAAAFLWLRMYRDNHVFGLYTPRGIGNLLATFIPAHESHDNGSFSTKTTRFLHAMIFRQHAPEWHLRPRFLLQSLRPCSRAFHFPPSLTNQSI